MFITLPPGVSISQILDNIEWCQSSRMLCRWRSAPSPPPCQPISNWFKRSVYQYNPVEAFLSTEMDCLTLFTTEFDHRLVDHPTRKDLSIALLLSMRGTVVKRPKATTVTLTWHLPISAVCRKIIKKWCLTRNRPIPSVRTPQWNAAQLQLILKKMIHPKRSSHHLFTLRTQLKLSLGLPKNLLINAPHRLMPMLPTWVTHDSPIRTQIIP